MTDSTHLPFQLFPTLDPATEAALRASIERFGVLVPVVVDQHGQVLDGHHRRKIADEVGAKYRVDIVNVADEDEGAAIAHTLNSDRRHMDADQRRQVVADLRAKGHSLRAIAGAVGVSQTQVARDLEAPTVTDVTVPERVTGLDGKSRPAKRPTIIAAKNFREAERAQDALLAAGDLPDVPVLDTKRVERIAREAEADRRRAEPVDAVEMAGTAETRHGDFREVLGDLGGQVDAIITDPPYPGEFVDLFRPLGALASQILKPSGVLVAMTGQYYLPQYLELLSENLAYRWTGAYLVSGQRNRNHGARVGTGWKPLLIFQRKDADVPEFLLDDVFASEGDDKAHHHWGQSESGMASIVERFTRPGDLIVDPFLGGGTTGVVARDLGRRFIGCDIDAAAVSTARERLA